jgi:hypothetical protein
LAPGTPQQFKTPKEKNLPSPVIADFSGIFGLGPGVREPDPVG